MLCILAQLLIMLWLYGDLDTAYDMSTMRYDIWTEESSE